MSTTVATALELARSFLSDDIAVEWTDPRLMPKVRQAHGEIIAKMNLNGMQVTRKESTAILVTAGTKDLGASLPVDLVEPIKMQEYATSETADEAVGMAQKEFVPTWLAAETLRVWVWSENKILFIGATTDRNILLYYHKGIVAPTMVSDVLPIIGSEIYIGPRVAALAVVKDQPLYAAINQVAQENLSTLVRTMVKVDQSLPARKMPFSARYRRSRRLSF